MVNGRPLRGVGGLAQGVLGLVGAAEAVIEVDNAARPSDEAVPDSCLDFRRLDGAAALSGCLGKWPADFDERVDGLMLAVQAIQVSHTVYGIAVVRREARLVIGHVPTAIEQRTTF